MSRPLHLSRLHRHALTLASVALAFAACQDPTGSGRPHGADEPVVPSFTHLNFTMSTGIYRIPYADGTTDSITRDHHDHTPVDRIDMVALNEATPLIVAAASGIIRAIVDQHGNDYGAGNNEDKNGDPQDDSLEHSCNDGTPAVANSVVVGFCSDYNNYVWIEHPNGEWTKYSHFRTGTVTGNGWVVGDTIEAGEVLGEEGDVGRAGGVHLHFEVGLPYDPTDPTPFCSDGGFMVGSCDFGVNLVPRVCDILNNIFVSDSVYTANPCNHQPPTADAGGPYIVAEGSPIVLDGGGSSDPDGNPLTFSWAPVLYFLDPSLEKPTFVAGDNGVIAVTLTVYDQIEALPDSDNTTVTVSNVAPTVTIDPTQIKVIDEGGTVTVHAEFTDPGWEDTHSVTVDWGVPPGHAGTLITAPSIQIMDPGGLGVPRRGHVSATYRYGDNDSGAGFTVTVTVTDDDGGVGSDSFVLTVDNVDPAVLIDATGTILFNGVPTVIASAGDDVAFSAHADDPGSDDLTLTWDWGDGTSDDHVTLVNPPAADPLPSPTVQPRSEPFGVTHVFVEACLYDVNFSATDDDDGSADASIAVIIVGNADRARSAGYWSAEYRLLRNADFTPATLQCYLDIVNHVSAVFSQHRALASLDDAAEILKSAGSSNADDIFDVQLLAAWLNFANGAYGHDELVDSNGDGTADTAFLDIMVAAESLRVDPNRTKADVLAMKDVLERLNTADEKGKGG